jgi:methylenetetrahydrofolate dehydrogenase (NADP+)/methenyltetrahydrofolate cyclohydrolase
LRWSNITTETKILDGRQLAFDRRTILIEQIRHLQRTPVLKVILVGDHPASQIYVKHKMRAASAVGIAAETIWLPATISEFDLLEMIHHFNYESIDGIIVQLPLPAHINLNHVLEAIKPSKDVDGFHPLNVGRLAAGGRQNVPCTARGIMLLLEASGKPLQGADALVIGCSAIVGRPVCTLLIQASATVTNAHLLTHDLPAICQRADIIVVAAGCPNLIRGHMLKAGVVLIDVGITRLTDGTVCGDIAYEECLGIAGSITPVPGGVGPMTIACLLENTVAAAIARGST